MFIFLNKTKAITTLFVTLLLQFGGSSLKEEEMTAENVKKQMTDEEWQKVYDMSRDKNLYQNLCSSLFPTIHGSTDFIYLMFISCLTALYKSLAILS